MQLWRTWMRILLDESVPRDLRDYLPQHEVVTVQFKSQAGKVNQMARFSGSLLRISAF